MTRKRKVMDDRSSMKVTHVPRIARRLVSVAMDGKAIPHVDEAIVRLYPQADSTPAMIDSWEADLRERGAVAVKRMPRPRARRVFEQGTHAVAKVATVRQVVEGMVEDATTTDRDALCELIGTVLDAEGL